MNHQRFMVSHHVAGPYYLLAATQSPVVSQADRAIGHSEQSSPALKAVPSKSVESILKLVCTFI